MLKLVPLLFAAAVFVASTSAYSVAVAGEEDHIAKRDFDFGTLISQAENLTKSVGQVEVSDFGLPVFLGVNQGVGSWYETSSTADSTNGHSWCGYPYNDWVPGFAPDVSAMLSVFDGNYEEAAKAFCGLEALVTTSDGRAMLLYIADGFDPKWVRSPGSIDIIRIAWSFLANKLAINKNDVVQTSWVLTGRRSLGLSFKGPGGVFP